MVFKRAGRGWGEMICSQYLLRFVNVVCWSFVRGAVQDRAKVANALPVNIVLVVPWVHLGRTRAVFFCVSFCFIDNQQILPFVNTMPFSLSKNIPVFLKVLQQTLRRLYAKLSSTEGLFRGCAQSVSRGFESLFVLYCIFVSRGCSYLN